MNASRSSATSAGSEASRSATAAYDSSGRRHLERSAPVGIGCRVRCQRQRLERPGELAPAPTERIVAVEPRYRGSSGTVATVTSAATSRASAPAPWRAPSAAIDVGTVRVVPPSMDRASDPPHPDADQDGRDDDATERDGGRVPDEHHEHSVAARAGMLGGMSDNARPPRILLDCDPGHDDAMAIVAAARYADLVGITTVAGNAPLERTTYNALVMRDLLGPRRAGARREPTAARRRAALRRVRARRERPRRRRPPRAVHPARRHRRRRLHHRHLPSHRRRVARAGRPADQHRPGAAGRTGHRPSGSPASR